VASWRAAGRRGLLLVLRDGVFFVEPPPAGGEELAVSLVPKMRFPHPKDPAQRQHRTLLDGILVEDDEGGKKVLRYLVFDALVFEGGILMRKPLSQRLKFVADGVVGSRKRDTAHDYRDETFKIRMKEQFELPKIEFLLRKVLPAVTHKTDGLVFTPKDSPYEAAGTISGAGGPNMLKALFVWRPGGEVSEGDLVSKITTVVNKGKG